MSVIPYPKSPVVFGKLTWGVRRRTVMKISGLLYFLNIAEEIK